MTIGNKIRTERKKLGLSQKDLKKMLNLGGDMIVSFWENDKYTPNAMNLICLADIFNISLDELCCREIWQMRKIYITTIFIILLGIWTFSVKTAKSEAVNSMNICYDTRNITLEIDEMPYVSSNEETLEYIFEKFNCSENPSSSTGDKSETTCYISTSVVATQFDTVAGKPYTASQLRKLGAVEWGGWRWTWYSEKVLKGNGLKIEGRHKDENGYICDKDGYICCASDVLEFGTVIDTPFGKQGKIYDCGCPSDTIDVYVGW